MSGTITSSKLKRDMHQSTVYGEQCLPSARKSMAYALQCALLTSESPIGLLCQVLTIDILLDGASLV